MRYSPSAMPVNSKRPALSVMVKLTREESFFFISVMVALATGCFDKVSKATPFTVPFCAMAVVLKITSRKAIQFNRLIAVDLQLRKYSYTNRKRVNQPCFNVNQR